jgi:hypothetical protein
VQVSETEPEIESTRPLALAVSVPLPVMPKLGSPDRLQSNVVALAEPIVSASRQAVATHFKRIIQAPMSPLPWA